MADVDEALVEALKTAIYDALHAETMRSAPYDAAGVHASRDRVARAVLAHLGGQLAAQGWKGEERVEWSSRTPADPEPDHDIGEEFARRRTRVWLERHRRPAATVKRTVRTWTLLGPWVEVEG